MFNNARQSCTKDKQLINEYNFTVINHRTLKKICSLLRNRQNQRNRRNQRNQRNST